MKPVIKAKLAESGFNLIEILLTLALASFLLGYGLPSYQRIIEQKKQALELSRLQAVFNHARLIASYSNRTLIICPSDKGKQCDYSANKNGNLLLVTDGKQQPIHFSKGTGFPLVFPSHELKVHPLPSHNSGGTLLACTGFNQVEPKGIVISPTGRIRISNEITSSLVALCPN